MMLNDYLYAIGKYLPSSERNDILKEIESALYDYLEIQFGKKEYTNEEVESAIVNMGNPKKVAYLYTGKERYLIAPIYLDIYFLIIKVALLGISIAFAVIAVLSSVESKNIFTLITGFLGNIWQAGLMMIAIVTIIFAAISKYELPEKHPKEVYENWSIKDLKKSPADINIIKTSNIIIETIFIVLFLTFVNSPSFSFGVKSNNFLLALNTELVATLIVWINISLIFNLILNIFLLIKREWSVFIRILSVISDILGLTIFGVIAFHPNLFDFTKVTALEPDVIDAIILGTSIGFRIGFLAVLVITSIEVYKQAKIILNKNKII